MYVVDCSERFDWLSDEYESLYASATATLFQHPNWLNEIYATLAEGMGADPAVVTIRSDGRLVAVLPLVRRRGRVRRLEFADLGVSDYTVPVIAADVEAALLADPSVPKAIRHALGPADLLTVPKVPASATRLTALLGGPDVVRLQYDAHVIELGTSFEDWRSARDLDFTRHLDNKRKRIGRKQRVLALRELKDVDEIDGAFALMREFRRSRFSDRRAIDLVQDPEYYEFYRRAAHDGATKGGPGSTTVLTINDEIVGVSFGLSDSSRDLFVLIGYDFDRYRNYSLGLVMVEELIKVSIANGKTYHDLTLGHEGYKQDFGAEATPMFAVHMTKTPVGWAAKTAAAQNTAARHFAKRALAYRDEHLRGRGLSEVMASLRGRRG
ncbi:MULTISPECIES: GNAT family N-acetyltransferase [Mumia]|uniref:GNAT family N-acetyltransferase n=1 Tax=Mumia TaxID=1546255 RepID=UPI00141E0C7F|nr:MULTISPECIES: GNAT family N-acetyltransferase [unclassified Mumia]QMW67123.1 GNAT family N-acetyltransferase [Mumia sp. ZJ1417]